MPITSPALPGKRPPGGIQVETSTPAQMDSWFKNLQSQTGTTIGPNPNIAAGTSTGGWNINQSYGTGAETSSASLSGYVAMQLKEIAQGWGLKIDGRNGLVVGGPMNGMSYSDAVWSKLSADQKKQVIAAGQSSFIKSEQPNFLTATLTDPKIVVPAIIGAGLTLGLSGAGTLAGGAGSDTLLGGTAADALGGFSAAAMEEMVVTAPAWVGLGPEIQAVMSAVGYTAAAYEAMTHVERVAALQKTFGDTPPVDTPARSPWEGQLPVVQDMLRIIGVTKSVFDA